jgi:hypothetical protein
MNANLKQKVINHFSIRSINLGISLLVLSLLWTVPVYSAGKSAGPANKKQLLISQNKINGKVTITWSGKGSLREINEPRNLKKFSKSGKTTYEFTPTGDHGFFKLDANTDPIYSANVVGYVNLTLAPGISLIANPLYYTNNTLAFWWPTAPDGAQILKYVAGVGYEVSTFDGLSGSWSKPNLEVPIGTGFFFRNPSTNTLIVTFVGEVLQGNLINPLPGGYSCKGALVPQEGSINTVHAIPGRAGDHLRLYVNEGLQGGHYEISEYSDIENAWVPDLTLGVGQGFWIYKQQPMDWLRIFFVN